MIAEPQTFSPMYVSMIKVAEARGGIPETLKMLAKNLEARQRLLRQARSAMIYPIAVLTIAAAVIGLITIFVLPKILAILQDFNRKSQLPGMTQALMSFSNFMQLLGWWLVPAVMIGTPGLPQSVLQDARGQEPSGSHRPDDARAGHALPQDRHHPLRPDPLRPARRGARLPVARST